MKGFEFWISVLGNVGVIGGFVLVAIQLNQNSELLRLQMLDLESQRFSTQEIAMVGEDGAKVWEKVLENPADLSIAEQRIAEALIWPAFEAWRNSYNLHKEGLLGDEWRYKVIAQAPYYLDHTYGRAWWSNFKEIATETESLPNELRDLIDRLLRDARDTHVEYHRNIMDKVRDAQRAQNDA